MKNKGIVFLALIFVSLCYAQESPQTRIVFNSWRNLNENNSLYLRFVIPDLVESHHPNIWFGGEKKFSESFKVAVMAGRTMKKEENTHILSIFPVFSFGKLCMWNEIDYNFKPKNFYNFTEIRYLISDWLKIGLDNENVFGEDGFYSLAPVIDIVMTDHMAITFAYFWKMDGIKRTKFFRFYLKFF